MREAEPDKFHVLRTPELDQNFAPAHNSYYLISQANNKHCVSLAEN